MRYFLRCSLAMLMLATATCCAAQQASLDQVASQAVCRVVNRAGNATDIGSGTLIDVTDDGRQGLVLTCAHLFADAAGDILVEFPNRKTHGARLVAIDRRADLAALAICNPSTPSATITHTFEPGDTVTACGFGSRGELRCIRGPVVGNATSAGQHSMQVRGDVRSGDSGGAVFDSRGRLVAVVWGQSAGITYASTGRPLRQFLQRVLGTRASSTPTTRVVACPGGVCPRQPSIPQSPVPRPDDALQSRITDLADRVQSLETNKQDHGDYVTSDQLQQYVRQERFTQLETDTDQGHRHLAERIDQLVRKAPWGQLARSVGTGMLGISGPAGWGILAATTLGGALAGRFWKRRGAGGRRRPFPVQPPTNATDTET